MNEFYVGLILCFIIFLGYRFIGQYIQFTRSIYREVYSNIFEYRMRCKSIDKMSESYWYKQQFGAHKISYMVFENNKKKSIQAYLFLILSSGLYIINVRNSIGGQKPDVTIEVKAIERRVREILGDTCPPIYLSVVFPDRCGPVENKCRNQVSMIRRKEMNHLIKTQHEASAETVLSKEAVGSVYQKITGQLIL